MHSPVRYLVLCLLLATLVACQAAPAPTAAPGPAPVAQPTAIPPTAAPPTATSAPPTTTAIPPTPTVAPTPTPAMARNTTLSAFTTANFTGSGNCAACHTDLKNKINPDLAITNHWRGTTMANAAKDPVWQAKVSSEVARAPGLQAVIEATCANCHMPMAEVQATAQGGKVTILGDGFLNKANPLHEAAMEGVSCTLCHQIQADGAAGTKASFSGGYSVDTKAKTPDRPLYGPYGQQVGQMMQAASGFKPIQGTHLGKSEYCATCHNLYTLYVDAAGKVLGEFPEQTPYTEWQNSWAYPKTPCQICHMPPVAGGVVISTLPATGLPERQPFALHDFSGGNSFVLTMIRDHGIELGVTADPAQFDATRARVADLLGKKSATLTMKSLEQKADTLVAQVQVTALTGHKFPTSFPARRAWLHVTVADALGKVIFESGRPRGDGAIVGNNADADPTKFEPHYDVITAADQVQIYEPIMGDNEGKVTYTLLRGGKYLKDNRLLPAGFNKAAAPADIAVYGEAAKDANFIGGGDVVTYQVDVKGQTGPFTVSAELLYEPLSYQFIQDTLKDGTDLTKRLGSYYAAADKTPAVVATMQPAKTK